MKDQKLDFYKRSFTFSLKSIALADSLPNKRSCWIITDQLLRASTSIGANIIEAKAASSKKDYINFYSHALKSANETIYWLSLLKESNNISSDMIDPFINEAKQLANILAASILTMKGKRNSF